MSVITTLLQNARRFPRLAAVTAAAYIIVGVAIGIRFGVYAAIIIMAALMFLDFVAYFVIASNPVWYSRCQRAADSLYLIFSGKQDVIEASEEAPYYDEDGDDMDWEPEEEEPEPEPEPEPEAGQAPEEGSN